VSLAAKIPGILLAIRAYVESSSYGSIGLILKINPQSVANLDQSVHGQTTEGKQLFETAGSQIEVFSRRMQALSKNIQLFIYCCNITSCHSDFSLTRC